MQTQITRRLTATGHAGDLAGTDTWMLFNQTQQKGIIYLANGNPSGGFLPFQGSLIVHYLLYSLFTKQITDA
jgi:hypothetical protein